MFDDSTDKNALAKKVEPREDAQATIIDQALEADVIAQIRELRQGLSSKAPVPKYESAEKTAFMDAPDFDEEHQQDDPFDAVPTPYDDDEEPPTMFDLQNATFEGPAFSDDADAPTTCEASPLPGFQLPPSDGFEQADFEPAGLDIEETVDGSEPYRFDSIGVLQPPALSLEENTDDELRHALLREGTMPPKHESVEYTRKEPIPLELFLDPSVATEEEAKFPESKRPPMPRPFSRGESNPPETLLDAAAQLGIAPEAMPGAAYEEVTEDPDSDSPGLELPRAEPEPEPLKLDQYLDEEPQRARPSKAGMATEDIRRLAESSKTASKIIPGVIAVFVVVATLYMGVRLFTNAAPKAKQQHVELRFLTTLNGRQVDLVSTRAATTKRIMIDTTPQDVLVVHNRQILGRTPVSADIPIDLGANVGVELSSPYFETWIGQISPNAAGEYTIGADLTKKQ